MLNRRKMPAIRPVGDIKLSEPREWRLRNGLAAYSVDAGTQAAVRIELIFFAGRPYEHKRLISRAAVDMLRDGCEGFDATALSDHFDYYGATLSFPTSLDTVNVVLTCLNKHLAHVLPVFAAMMAEPIFPEKELSLFCKQNQQLLKEDLSQSDVVAYREITACIFGANHPYGYNSVPEDYANLQRSDLLLHHRQYVQAGNGLVLLAGRVTPEVEALVDQYLGQLPSGEAVTQPSFPACPEQVSKVFINKPDSWQTSLRIGKRMFNRHHPDAAGFSILDTLVGGYFGSRLMTNIREDKGFTYNIESSFDPMHYDGCWYIECEVGNDSAEETLSEIYRELDVLRRKLVPAAELNMLKNYLLGSYLSMIDGPFNTVELLRSILSDQLPYESFPELVEKTRSITSRELRELAIRYFEPESFWQVIVGPKASQQA